MPDPVSVASGISAAGALVSVWQLRRRALRAEAEIEYLQAELAAERHAASHDPLTGLPNRRAFYRIAAALLTDAGGRPLIAVVLDLNDFKQVNDRYGHAAGDQVLVSVAQRLTAFAGDNLVARLGGDEFAGLLSSPSVDRRWIDHATRRLCEAMAAPIPVGGRSVRVTASVGLAPVNGPTQLAEALCAADAAMYRAKGVTGRRSPRQLLDAPRLAEC
ncbi:GGDEF domain-containing protein [Micromonospora sp. DPT]|uniref:GGDEF domain-containing protein n=1 Tax=Micromonospora sp. DPT TaxID=3142975 RepID=UPI00320BB161